MRKGVSRMTEHVTREREQERIVMAEIEVMPALLDTVQEEA